MASTATRHNVTGSAESRALRVEYSTHGSFHPTVEYQPSANQSSAIEQLFAAPRSFSRTFDFIPNASCTALALWIEDAGSVECTITIDGVVVDHELGLGSPNKGRAGHALCTASVKPD